jgi:hypothetical protein
LHWKRDAIQVGGLMVDGEFIEVIEPDIIVIPPKTRKGDLFI